MSIHILFNGLGAGNIGDEAMMQGFLSMCPLPDRSSIEVWDNTSTVLRQFPPRYDYVNYDDEGACKELCLSSDLVLLVGDTPVMEKWGLDWPLRILTAKLEFCHEKGIPCHAVGVGIDLLETEEAKTLFKRGFLPIDSWSVRSLRSRENLIALGLKPSRIFVAADLAWLMPCREINQQRARDYLYRLGVKENIPLIGVNVVNEIWKDNISLKKEIASALDHVINYLGWQVAFYCNETRDGEYFDKEAAFQVASFMENKAVIIPNEYFTPQEMVSLLSCCELALSCRYHFTVMSYLAGVIPISVIRGEKIQELVEDIGCEHVGELMEITDGKIIRKVEEVHEHIDGIRAYQEVVKDVMRLRSKLNLFFLGPTPIDSYLLGIEAVGKLSSVSELKSKKFGAFMKALNLFAQRFGLREFTDWSKVWEYPWLWFNGLSKVNWLNAELLDMGSEISPMPWFLASLGAKVTLTETNGRCIPYWERIRDVTGFNVKWKIVHDGRLPLEDEAFDVVTSFSVIEHQRDKVMALNEMARILKPGGLLAISFDICEPTMGMTFPEWNGKALTMAQFEELIWNHPEFDNGGLNPEWNVGDIPEFIKWHLQSAPHHNYVVGAAILKKKS